MNRIDLPDEITVPLGRLLRALKDLRGATGRRFTLDGVALGDLGEAVAAWRYGVNLHSSQSTKGSDGVAPRKSRRSVEVKITQREEVAIASHSDRPDHLLVFHLDRESGAVDEVYNGPARPAWKRPSPSPCKSSD